MIPFVLIKSGGAYVTCNIPVDLWDSLQQNVLLLHKISASLQKKLNNYSVK